MLIQIKLENNEETWFKKICEQEDRSYSKMAKRLLLKSMPTITSSSNDLTYQQDPRYKTLMQKAAECDDPSLKSDLYDEMNAIQQEYKNCNK